MRIVRELAQESIAPRSCVLWKAGIAGARWTSRAVRGDGELLMHPTTRAEAAGGAAVIFALR
jgi:hypothetical protein